MTQRFELIKRTRRWPVVRRLIPVTIFHLERLETHQYYIDIAILLGVLFFVCRNLVMNSFTVIA